MNVVDAPRSCKKIAQIASYIPAGMISAALSIAAAKASRRRLILAIVTKHVDRGSQRPERWLAQDNFVDVNRGDRNDEQGQGTGEAIERGVKTPGCNKPGAYTRADDETGGLDAS